MSASALNKATASGKCLLLATVVLALRLSSLRGVDSVLVPTPYSLLPTNYYYLPSALLRANHNTRWHALFFEGHKWND